jgi:protein TonB
LLARRQGVPAPLVAFIVVSILLHSIALFFTLTTSTQIAELNVGDKTISAILLPAANTAAVAAKVHIQKRQQKTAIDETVEPITEKAKHTVLPRHTAKNDLIITAPLAEQKVVKAASATNKASSISDPGPNPTQSATTITQQTPSLAVRREQQRNYLLGELQNRLSRYLTYPARARRRGWQGKVMLAFDIDERGQLNNVRLAKSSGYALLDHSAMTAISRLAHIELPRSMGHLQAMELALPVRYELRES